VIPDEGVEAEVATFAAAVWALTEAAAAADHCTPDEADFYKLDKAEVGNWLRARAAEMWEARIGASRSSQ
jgi:uncharacterized protein YcaQ